MDPTRVAKMVTELLERSEENPAFEKADIGFLESLMLRDFEIESKEYRKLVMLYEQYFEYGVE